MVPSNQQPSENDGAQENSQEQDQQPQQEVGSGSQFLDLPLEIRFNIYRRLLLADGPVQYLGQMPGPRPHGIDTGIMTTCSQVQREGRVILYGENTLKMNLYQFLYLFKSYFRQPCECCHPMNPILRKRLQETKSFEIVYREITDSMPADQLLEILTLSEEACTMMCQLTDIRSVSLNLAAVSSHSARGYLLCAWSALRNIGRAVVDAGGLLIPEYLSEQFISGATTQSPLPRMLHALEKYAGQPRCCSCLLDQAKSFAERGDLENFKKVQEKIIAAVDKSMEEAKNEMKKYDPGSASNTNRLI